MNVRPYGKNGFDVSAFGVGCMRLPRIFDANGNTSVDKDKAIELIRYAVDHGVTYFDSAYSYHNTTSESVLGEALDGGYREKVRIATKQPLGVMKTQADIGKNLENTLKKLRTDHIDMYLIHNINGSAWDTIKERKIIQEYEKFRAEGLIGGIGFSYHGPFPGFKDILEYYQWNMCQIQQNMLDGANEATTEAIRLAGKRGTALVIMEPLRGGGLANAPSSVKAIYDTSPIKRSPVEWAFRYLLDFPEVSTILSGVTTLEQLKDNIEIFSKPDAVPNCLTATDKEILVKAKAAYESIVTIPCTGCEYCLPCPQGVGIPKIFELYNNGFRFESFDQQKRSYTFIAMSGGKKADVCVECNVCKKKCPQQIDIPNQLKVAHEALAGWVE